MTIEITEERLKKFRNERDELEAGNEKFGIEKGKAWALAGVEYTELRRVAKLAENIRHKETPAYLLACAHLGESSAHINETRGALEWLIGAQDDEDVDEIAIGFVIGATEVFELI